MNDIVGIQSPNEETKKKKSICISKILCTQTFIFVKNYVDDIDFMSAGFFIASEVSRDSGNSLTGQKIFFTVVNLRFSPYMKLKL